MRIKYENTKIGCMCNGRDCLDREFCICVNYQYDPDYKEFDVVDKFDDVYKYENLDISF
jgi:hypothetical protein